MRRPHRRTSAAAVVIGWLAALLGAATPAAAAEYTMVTTADYVVDPAGGAVAVAVEITFTNTYAAPAGQVSVFRDIRLAIHDHAAAVAARDSDGTLSVSAAVSGGVNVATVRLRSGVEYRESVALTLTYELRAADDPAIRVDEHLISFPVWGFGTSSAVEVDLPSDFEIRVDGDPLQATTTAGRTVLASGPIDDPAHWLAQIAASRQPQYRTMQRAVPLAGGTVDLQVRHWADDPEWGAATLDLLVDALPRLEAVIGLPYPGHAPVVVTEALTGGPEGSEPSEGELAIGFTEPPFTLLHQAAHLWLNGDLLADRWASEGLASWAADRVAAETDVDLPYDPAAVAARLEAEAFPLAEWTEPRGPDAEAWAQAASWAAVLAVSEQAGDDALRLTLARIGAGLDGYDPAPPELPTIGPPTVPASSRALLDQLDAATDAPVAETLAPSVLGEGSSDELAARAEARAAHATLLAAAGDWGDPDPVRRAMVEWSFGLAATEMASAVNWLAARDELLVAIGRAGLAVPDRLQAAYQLHGGGPEAWAEIEAQRSIVGAYAAASDQVAAGLDPVAAIAFLGGPSPEDRLAATAAAFAGGDLRAAADGLSELRSALDTAAAAGLVRILSVGVITVSGGLLAATAIRRWRRPSDYTPTP